MATKKILIISTDFGTEQDEIAKPLEALKQRGHDVTVATPSGKDVQTMTGDKDPGKVVPTDGKLADAASDVDVILLPGGTLNADAARMDDEIVARVKQQVQDGKTVAAICHAPWVLINAGVAKGKKLTSYESVELDLRNAGANWVDEEVVECPGDGWLLITSRTPDDLDAFIDAIDKA